MWPRMQPSTLLALVLCRFLLHPAVGFPFARQHLAKSAHGDDLISGSDFLSVFIGATVPRPRPVIRSHTYDNVSKRPDSVIAAESNTRAINTDDEQVDTSVIAFDIDSDTENAKFSSSEPSTFSYSDTDHNIRDKVNMNLGSVSTLGNDLNSISNSEINKSFPPSASENGILSLHGDTGHIDQIANSKIEFVSEDKKDGRPHDLHETEKDMQGTTSSPSELISSSISNVSSSTLGLEHAFSTFLVNSEPEISTDVPSENIGSNFTVETATLSFPQEHEFYDEADTSEVDLTEKTSLEEELKSENETHKVISVRVSSSIALPAPQQSNRIDNDNKDVFSSFLNSFPETSHNPQVNNNSSEETISLVTEEQPAITAIQRSQLSVEEALPSSSIISIHQESSSSKFNGRHSALPSQASIESPLISQSPVSYHTSVSTATSGSRVQFYSEPSSYHGMSSSVAETVQSTVVANHPHQPQLQNFGHSAPLFQGTVSLGDGSQQLKQQGILENFHQHSPSEKVHREESNRSQKSYEMTHQEPEERNYEIAEGGYGGPERIYARPEQNYEVDESVSVMTNGRVHGVQYPPATTPGVVEDTGLRDFSTQPGETRDPNSKFGYVVEGRNFRKYRVEERTPDGFIVGEYGVVSHDDGSLRGVRYTADGTTNPRLIYDALVKFLSL